MRVIKVFVAVSAIADIGRDHQRAESLWFMENRLFGRLSESKTARLSCLG